MRHKVVVTSNIVRLLYALEQLGRRGAGEEGMGLLWGLPGEGKSTAIGYVVNHHGGLFLRARVTWSVTSMLRALLAELSLEGGYFRDPMMEAVIRELLRAPRPIFVDEADYLFRNAEMLDALRDIYDNTRVPVVLIGMEDIARRMRTHERLSRFRRRITEWIEFRGLAQEDARRLADELCEVEVGRDLLERVYNEAAGNVGKIVIALSKIERLGFANSLPCVDLEHFAARSLS